MYGGHRLPQLSLQFSLPGAPSCPSAGNLPFALSPADAADMLTRRCSDHSLSLRRVAVSDFSLQGVAEFATAISARSHLVLPLDRPPDMAAPAQRKPRDEGKNSRGFALLCFSDAAAADAAAASGAFEGFKVQRASWVGRPYYLGACVWSGTRALCRSTLPVKHAQLSRACVFTLPTQSTEDIYRVQAEAAAAAAEKAERSAAAKAHRQRLRARQREARDRQLAALLLAALPARSGGEPDAPSVGEGWRTAEPLVAASSAGSAPLLQLLPPPPVDRPTESPSLHAAAAAAEPILASASAAAAAGADISDLWQRAAFSRWTDGSAALALARIDWDGEIPAAADPARGGGLGDGLRGQRKRQQVESVVAVLRAGWGRSGREAGRLLWPGAHIVDFGSGARSGHSAALAALQPLSHINCASQLASQRRVGLPPHLGPAHTAGTGNLALPLAAIFRECTVTAVDLKEESVRLLADRAAAAGLENVRAVCGSIEDFRGAFDCAVALHVCGDGSDASLEAAVQRDATFVARGTAPSPARTLAAGRPSLRSRDDETRLLVPPARSGVALLRREDQQRAPGVAARGAAGEGAREEGAAARCRGRGEEAAEATRAASRGRGQRQRGRRHRGSRARARRCRRRRSEPLRASTQRVRPADSGARAVRQPPSPYTLMHASTLSDSVGLFARSQIRHFGSGSRLLRCGVAATR